MISELRVPLSGTSLSNVAKLAEQKGMLSYAHATFIEIKKLDRSIRVSLDHAIYLWDIVNNFDYYYEAVIPIAFEDTFVVDYATGRYHNVIGFDLMPVFFSSFSEPIATTQQYVDWAALKEGDVVIDLGAYSGLSAILFHEVVGRSGRVVALEPDETNLAATRKNVALYKAITGNAIEVVGSAAWEHGDGITFSCEGNMGASATAFVGARGRVTTVTTTTLAGVMERFALPKLDFVKIDIEGAEETVLRSAVELLRAHRPRIVIEPHMIAGGLSADACEVQLKAAGYRIERIHQHGANAMTGSSLPLLLCTPT